MNLLQFLTLTYKLHVNVSKDEVQFILVKFEYSLREIVSKAECTLKTLTCQVTGLFFKDYVLSIWWYFDTPNLRCFEYWTWFIELNCDSSVFEIFELG